MPRENAVTDILTLELSRKEWSVSTVSTERLTQMFVEAADTLVEEFDLIEFLASITIHVATASGHAAVGLLLADRRGQLQFMAASEESARLLELSEVQNSDGPCQECLTSGERVIEADLGTAHHRWPTFTSQALAAGFRSACSLPMRHHGQTIGTLGLFGVAGEVLTKQDLAVVQGLADIATIGILQERSVSRKDMLTEQLQVALDSRVAIEQAKGILAQLLHTDVDTAFTRLWNFSRGNRLRLSDVARDVVSDPASHPELTSPQSAEATERKD